MRSKRSSIFGSLRGLRYRAAILVLVCLAAPAADLRAAASIPGFAARTSASASAPQSPQVSAAELKKLLDTLQNDQARARLTEELRALIAAEERAAAGKSGVATPGPGPAALFTALPRQIEAVSAELLAGAAVLVDAPRLFAWGCRQIADPTARQRWIEDAQALALIFGIGLLAEWLLRRVLARLLPRLPARQGSGWPPRALFAVLDAVFAALPVLAFAGAGYAVLSMPLANSVTGRVILTVLLNATIEARLILAVARSILLPGEGGLVPIDEATRRRLYVWTRRFTGWAVFGYAIPLAGWWLGIPAALHALMLKVVGLGLAVLAVVFVLQNRAAIAGWIAGPAPAAPEEGEVAVAPSSWARTRRSLAEIWHVPVVLYIVGVYLIYALRVESGSLSVVQATVLTLFILGSAQLLARLAHALSRRGLTLSPELAARFPTLEQRAKRYVALSAKASAVVVYAVAGLAALEAWQVPAFAWFGSDLGQRVVGTLLSIGVVLAASFAVWEFFAVAIERHLKAIDAAAPRRTRQRTLLPLLRTAMLCVIVIMAALIVLSQLGIDIAPLLAGAGVVGLAIGFGSQALIKDIITGLFILIEDQVAVGDIVDLGKEHAGVVEAISIRTIRLRDLGGIVHTVPFGEVTTVKNLTKDFANVVARISIAQREDIDRVVEILRGVSEELMADETLGPSILNPFDYMGVDGIDPLWVTLLLRIRTLPGKQWQVGRAFNRLVKIAFDNHGIAMRDPAPVMIAMPLAGHAAEAAAAAPERLAAAGAAGTPRLL